KPALVPLHPSHRRMPERLATMDDIFQRAARVGVETEYWDGLGQLHKVEPEVLRLLVDALTRDEDRPKRILPPRVLVRGNSTPETRLGAAEGLPFHWEIISDRTVAEGEGTSPSLKLPPGLPCGIYRICVCIEQDREEAPLIVCPDRVYQGEPTAPRRMWALAV